MLLRHADGGKNFPEQVSKELSGQVQEDGHLENVFGRVGESVSS